ncbi:MAG: hypothetical protein E6474_09690 [Actinomyces sp.]|uniref:hypothetical protein n=1 Tax=Pauljensenia sp. UMB10120 TaxID=3046356 RepID=UPI0025505FD8|nr:hypothetical protein [Pauljensenia sp. UMB10120]MDU6662559.1 hypothetical protein [Actinomyces sp.]
MLWFLVGLRHNTVVLFENPPDRAHAGAFVFVKTRPYAFSPTIKTLLDQRGA